MLQRWKALSDETRLRILKLLEKGELCVCHIMAVLDMGQSRISRHMGILKQAGLVDDRRTGKWVFYRLAEGAVDEDIGMILHYLRDRLNEHPLVCRDTEQLSQLADDLGSIVVSAGSNPPSFWEDTLGVNL
jgi:DNA-binding transcriptional ArsR family regulator